MITVEANTTAAIAKLETLRSRLRETTRRTVKDSADRLLTIVQTKLSGEVLHSRSGKLLRSIRAETLENSEGISARVFSDGTVPYARVQEYGGRLNIPAITAERAKALAFEWEGRLIFARSTAAHTVDIPERSYMRTSLDAFEAPFAESVNASVGDALT